MKMETVGPGSHLQPVEHRRAARQKAVLMVCRLVAPGDDHLCLVRDISEFGAKAQTAQQLQVGDRITLEFGNCYRLTGTVRWTRDRCVGMEFDKAAELSPILGARDWFSQQRERTPGTLATDTRRTHPRLRRWGQVALYRQGREFLAELHDLSLSGAGMDLDASAECTLQAGDWLLCEIAGIGERTATVRWTQHNRLGLSFDQALPLRTLDNWFVSLMQGD